MAGIILQVCELMRVGGGHSDPEYQRNPPEYPIYCTYIPIHILQELLRQSLLEFPQPQSVSAPQHGTIVGLNCLRLFVCGIVCSLGIATFNVHRVLSKDIHIFLGRAPIVAYKTHVRMYQHL